MVHEKLQNKEVFKAGWITDMKFDSDAAALIDNIVRRLVLSMRSIESDGVETREQIEKYVISSLQKAEYLYYGLNGEGLDAILNIEKMNADARTKFYLELFNKKGGAK